MEDQNKIYQKIMLRVAKTFSAPANKRTRREFHLTELGICDAFSRINFELGTPFRQSLLNLMQGVSGKSERYTFWFPTRHLTGTEDYEYKYDSIGSLYAIMLATLTIKESLEMYNSPYSN